jgi:hypothetical protein
VSHCRKTYGKTYSRTCGETHGKTYGKRSGLMVLKTVVPTDRKADRVSARTDRKADKVSVMTGRKADRVSVTIGRKVGRVSAQTDHKEVKVSVTTDRKAGRGNVRIDREAKAVNVRHMLSVRVSRQDRVNLPVRVRAVLDRLSPRRMPPETEVSVPVRNERRINQVKPLETAVSVNLGSRHQNRV